MRSASTYAYSCLRDGKDLFHRNIRFILNTCFPGMGFDEQMRRTWLTDSVLCSAERECGPVSLAVARECRDRYLDQQPALFPQATVVALGKKAARRLKGTAGLLIVDAAAPPRGASKAARETWKKIAERVHAKRVPRPGRHR
jgi:hypothetical protein